MVVLFRYFNACEIQLIFPSTCTENIFLTLPLSVSCVCHFLLILLRMTISNLLPKLFLRRLLLSIIPVISSLLSAFFIIFKFPIRPCTVHYYHIWAGASAVVCSMIDKVQERIVNIISPTLTANLQPLSHHHHSILSLSLFYNYYNVHCSSELYFLFRLVGWVISLINLTIIL